MSQDPSNCNLLIGQLILSEPNNGVLLNNFKMNVEVVIELLVRPNCTPLSLIPII